MAVLKVRKKTVVERLFMRDDVSSQAINVV